MPSQLPPLDATSTMTLLPAILLGIGLAASSGLRTFLPLLLLCASSKWGLFGVSLSGNFAWLGSDTAFWTLLCATIAEVLGDKVPAVDHFLDAVGTLTRPLAGALGAAAVLNTQDPATAAILGLILGAPLALGVHSAKAATRGASTVTTAGLGNPVLSALEDFLAFFMAALALLFPLLVPLLLITGVWLSWKFWRALKNRARRTA